MERECFNEYSYDVHENFHEYSLSSYDIHELLMNLMFFGELLDYFGEG